MKKKLLVGLASALTLAGVIFGVSACGTNNATVQPVNATYKQELKQAIDALDNYQGAYAISTLYEAPDGNVNYLEIVKPDGDSYTEYPIDSSGNVGTQGVGYVLADWMTADNYYIVTSSVDTVGNPTTVFSTLPSSYRTMCADRVTLYLPRMIDKFTSIEKSEEIMTYDIGNGEEQFTLYTCKLPADCVRELIGVGSEGLFKCIKEDYSSDANIVKYCDYMQEEYDFTMIFGDANVTIGVAGGMTKYVSIEIGGLGTKAYYNKAVVTNLTSELRPSPDFIVTGNYVESEIKPTADYLASFANYDEAIKALQSQGLQNVDTIMPEVGDETPIEEVTEDTTEVTEDSTEEPTTEEAISEDSAEE